MTAKEISTNAARRFDTRETVGIERSSHDLAVQLMAAVEGSGLSVNEVARKAGIPQQVLQRFLSGKRDNVRLDTASKLAGFFGMRLTKPQVTPRRRRSA